MVFVPQLRRGDPLAQLVHDLHVGPAFLRRFDDLRAGEDHAVADAVVADVVHLVLVGHGEDDVGHGGRGRHEDLRDGDEIEALERLVGKPAVGPGDHRIRAHPVVAADGIGRPLQDGLSEIRRGDGHEPRDNAVMGADHLRALVGDEVGADKRGQAHDLGVTGVDVAAGDLEIPGDPHQAGQGAGGIEKVDVVLDGVAPLQGGGFGLGVHPGGLADRLRRHPGDPRNVFRGVLLCVLRQLVEAVGVLLHEILVVKTLLADDVDHGEGQGLDRPGPKLEPEVRLFGQLGPAGVDNDHLGAALELGAHLAVDLPLLAGGGQVAAPEKHQLRRVVQIGDGIKAAGVDARDFPSGMADVLRCDDVGGAEDVGQADQHEVLEPLRHADSEPHGPRAVLLLDLQEILRRLGEGLLPGDALPLPLAPRTGSLQGVLETIGMRETVGGNPSLETGVAPVEVPLGVSFDLDDLVTPDPDQQGAAAVVHPSAVCSDPPDFFCHLLAPFDAIRLEWEGKALVADHRNYVNSDTNTPRARYSGRMNLFVMPGCYRPARKEATAGPADEFYMSQMTYVLDFTGDSAK